jgi:hypothetical protein
VSGHDDLGLGERWHYSGAVVLGIDYSQRIRAQISVLLAKVAIGTDIAGGLHKGPGHHAAVLTAAGDGWGAVHQRPQEDGLAVLDESVSVGAGRAVAVEYGFAVVGVGRGGAVFDTAVRETGPLGGGEGGCRDQQYQAQQDQFHE